jgi:hypothetical protein
MSTPTGASPDIALVSAESELKPPGNCRKKEWKDLQKAVSANCRSTSTCLDWDKCEPLLDKLSRFLNCADARKAINDRCFGGGDPGHKLKVEQEVKGGSEMRAFGNGRSRLRSAPL